MNVKVIGASLLGIILLSVLLLIGEARLAMPRKSDHYNNPGHEPVHYGNKGSVLMYVVMGDSTAAGRGARYGIAQRTAEHLSRSYSVNMVNLGISGARLAGVVQEELSEAIKLKPDLVLLSIGANDITNFTSAKKLKLSLDKILNELASCNSHMQVVVTGSADLGTVPRFLQPLRWVAGWETQRVNKVIESVTKSHRAIWTPLAEETGPSFEKDPTLFDTDKFHPNDRGYAVWTPFLNTALDQACSKRGEILCPTMEK